MVEEEEARRQREAAKSGLEVRPNTNPRSASARYPLPSTQAWIYAIKEKAMEDDFEKIADEDEIALIKKAHPIRVTIPNQRPHPFPPVPAGARRGRRMDLR